MKLTTYVGTEVASALNIVVSHAENQRRASEYRQSWSGKKNVNSKLTEFDAKTIRLLKRHWDVSASELANLFSISRRTVYSIASGESWPHLKITPQFEEEVRRRYIASGKFLASSIKSFEIFGFFF
jgi:hypothetical protein